MQGIAINNTLLHKVKILTVPYQKGTVSYLGYPKSMIDFKAEGDAIHVHIPAMLAIELYRAGILPQNARESFPVSISGKKVGTYQVSDFRYPAVGSSSSDTISIQLTRTAGA